MNQQRTGLSDVLWIVRSELPHLWISYVLTGGFLLAMGGIVALIVQEGALGPELRGSQSFHADFVILLLTTLLATTYSSWGSISEWQNPAERRLAMMRMLPIPISTLVRSRLTLLLLSLVINVPAFFGALYLVADIRLSPAAYLAFVAVWIGYALVWSGLTMYVDVVRGSRFFFMSSFFSGLILIGVIVSLSAILGIPIVYHVAQLSSNYGLIIGPVALLLGAGAFALAGRATARGLSSREIAV